MCKIDVETQFYEAIRNNLDIMQYYNIFLKANPTFNYDCFDLELFITQIKMYLKDINNTESGFYAKIKKIIKDTIMNKKALDLRIAYTIFEHKYMMSLRLDCLFKLNILLDDS